jgi:hypothetical protein
VRPSKDGNPVPVSGQAPMVSVAQNRSPRTRVKCCSHFVWSQHKDALNSMDASEESDSDGDIDVTFWDVYEMGQPVRPWASSFSLTHS